MTSHNLSEVEESMNLKIGTFQLYSVQLVEFLNSELPVDIARECHQTSAFDRDTRQPVNYILFFYISLLRHIPRNLRRFGVPTEHRAPMIVNELAGHLPGNHEVAALTPSGQLS
jgi:hypothetical protein